MATFYKITIVTVLSIIIAIFIGVGIVLLRNDVVLEIRSDTLNGFLQNDNFVLEYDYGELHLGSFTQKPELTIINGVFKQANSGKVLLKIKKGTLLINPFYLIIGKVYISALKLKNVVLNAPLSTLYHSSNDKSLFDTAVSLPESLLAVLLTAEKSVFINRLQIENSDLILSREDGKEVEIKVEKVQFIHNDSDVISGEGVLSIKLNKKRYLIDAEITINTKFDKQLTLLLRSSNINLKDLAVFSPQFKQLDRAGDLLIDLRYKNKKLESFEISHISENKSIIAKIKQTPDDFDGGNLQVVFSVANLPVSIVDKVIASQLPLVEEVISLGRQGQFSASGEFILDSKYTFIRGNVNFNIPTFKVTSDLFHAPWKLQNLKGQIEILDLKSKNIRITVDKAMNNRGVLSATAVISDQKELDIQSTIKFNNIRVEDVISMIPVYNNDKVHLWLRESLSKGVLNNGTVSFRLKPRQNILLFNSSYDVSNVDVKFIDSMSAIKNLYGKIRGDEKTMDIVISKGDFDELSLVKGGTVFISYKEGINYLYTDLQARGTVKSLFNILNQEPIGLSKEINWSTKNAKGVGEYVLKLSMPIYEDVDVKDISYQTRMNFKNFSLPDGPFNLDVSTGEFSVNINSKSRTLKVKGTAIASDSSIHFDWKQKGYLKTEDIVQDVIFTVGLSPDGKRLLNFPIPFSARGYLHGELHWNQPKNTKTSTLSYEVDITDVDIIAQKYGVVKLAGFPGSFAGEVIKNNELINITEGNITIEENTANITAQIDISAKEFVALKLQSKAFGNHKNLDLTYSKTNALQVLHINADELNITNFSGFLSSSANQGSKRKYLTNIQTKKLFLVNDFYAEDVLLVISNTGIDISYLNFQSKGVDALTIKISKSNELKLKNNNSGLNDTFTRKLEINDLGRFFRVFLGEDVLDKGKLTYNYSQEGETLIGKLTIDNIKIKKIPFAIRILEFFSMLGTENAVSNKNFRILKAEGDVSYKEGNILIKKGSANAVATSMTFQGYIDYGLKLIDIKGTVSPLYQLSEIFNKVPLLERLLMDPDSGTILAINYSINGPFDKIELKTNPLLAVVPGLLKRFFYKSDEGSTEINNRKDKPKQEQDGNAQKLELQQ